MWGTFKRPGKSITYNAIVTARSIARRWPHKVTFRHVVRKHNVVADNMVRRCRDQAETVSYLLGELPEKAPPLDLKAVYVDDDEVLQPTPSAAQPPPKPAPPIAASVWGLLAAPQSTPAQLPTSKAAHPASAPPAAAAWKLPTSFSGHSPTPAATHLPQACMLT